ncbi:scavenger receptor cysteine-rich domain-containing group B protein-like [Cetorhinus maximus]
MLRFFLTLILLQLLNCRPGDSQAPTSETVMLRLVSGSSPCAGRVEILYRGQWGTVVHSLWDLRDAAVVCRELDCGTALSARGRAQFGEGSGPVVTGNVQCTGIEAALSLCPSARWDHYSQLAHDADAGVICSGRPGDNQTIPSETVLLRLVNGNSPCAGRVEVLYRGQWGTVVDKLWDMRDAAVVCRELDCGTALSAWGSAQFGEGSGPVVTGNVQCTGTEAVLSLCPAAKWDHYSEYSHSWDAGVICSGKTHPDLSYLPPDLVVSEKKRK